MTTNLELLKRDFDINYAPKMWHIQYKVGGPFICQNRPLTDRQLLNHLNGKYWVATRPLLLTRWCIIDLDNHSKVWGLLEGRVRKIVELLEPASPIEAESPRGMHLYYKLEEPTGVSRVQERITRRLEDSVPLEKGDVEIYPKATSCFRLPFGKSQSFDWETPIRILEL